jgi:hypothetical protein
MFALPVRKEPRPRRIHLLLCRYVSGLLLSVLLCLKMQVTHIFNLLFSFETAFFPAFVLSLCYVHTILHSIAQNYKINPIIQ